VPEHQEFGILGHLTPGQHHQAAEQTAHDQVDAREDHSGMISARKTPPATPDRVIEPYTIGQRNSAVQLAIEYDPRPPLDAGSLSKAPAQMAGLRAIIAHHAAVLAPPGGHSGGHADAGGKRPRKHE
jgi:hypothetical protein